MGFLGKWLSILILILILILIFWGYSLDFGTWIILLLFYSFLKKKM